jgi:hypothetical protein
MPEEDRPIAASEQLIRSAAKEKLPASRATISTYDQEIGFAFICCDRERARYATSTRRYDPHFGLDAYNLSRDSGHCGGEADVAFRNTNEHDSLRLGEERRCVGHCGSRTTVVFPAYHNGLD